MKNSEVIKEISKKLDLKENDVKNTINELVEIIIMKNCMGENVYISKLGKFMIVKKNERMVRNPRNGEKLLCKEYYYPKFKAKEIYKEKIKSAYLGEKDKIDIKT